MTTNAATKAATRTTRTTRTTKATAATAQNGADSMTTDTAATVETVDTAAAIITDAKATEAKAQDAEPKAATEAETLAAMYAAAFGIDVSTPEALETETAILGSVIGNATARQGMALRLRVLTFPTMSQDEHAAILGIGQSTVSKALQGARLALRLGTDGAAYVADAFAFAQYATRKDEAALGEATGATLGLIIRKAKDAKVAERREAARKAKADKDAKDAKAQVDAARKALESAEAKAAGKPDPHAKAATPAGIVNQTDTAKVDHVSLGQSGGATVGTGGPSGDSTVESLGNIADAVAAFETAAATLARFGAVTDDDIKARIAAAIESVSHLTA